MIKTPIDPTQPTASPKGSPERVAVYRARDEAGLPLYHPDDSQDVVPIECQHQSGGRVLLQRKEYDDPDQDDDD